MKNEKKKTNKDKPDDKAGIMIEDHILIRDAKTKKEIVNKRA